MKQKHAQICKVSEKLTPKKLLIETVYPNERANQELKRRGIWDTRDST